VTDALFRRQIRNSAWRSVRRGIATVAPRDVWLQDGSDEFDIARYEHALLAAAAALARPDHLVAARSAAILHGLPTRRIPREPILISTHGLKPGRFDNRTVRRSTVRPWDDEDWFGVPVTTLTRTICDLARLDGGEGLMTLDAALRRGLLADGDVDRALGWFAGWPGVRTARQVASLADRLSESPLESLVRWELHQSKLPPPELQVEVRCSQWQLYRVDFLWRAQRLILEADGRLKYDGDALWREKQRELELSRAGYRVERVVWDDLRQVRWRRLVARLRAHLLP
jgi:very-short-patch-repair endonuclease